MDYFMQHLNKMGNDTLFVFISLSAITQQDAIKKNIIQQMPIHMLKYAFEHKLKIKFILLDIQFHSEKIIMNYNLAGIFNMDEINQLKHSDESIIYQYKFNIDKIQENELTKKYKKYIFDKILESEIHFIHNTSSISYDFLLIEWFQYH